MSDMEGLRDHWQIALEENAQAVYQPMNDWEVDLTLEIDLYVKFTTELPVTVTGLQVPLVTAAQFSSGVVAAVPIPEQNGFANVILDQLRSASTLAASVWVLCCPRAESQPQFHGALDAGWWQCWVVSLHSPSASLIRKPPHSCHQTEIKNSATKSPHRNSAI
ncbi:hypothetical protein B0H14DRAFT_3132251 [Mycena olivaceomarginata]|nr:hypothetical protein B0H14DRAFT_3132251 [Mycena olivaceomarginata]